MMSNDQLFDTDDSGDEDEYYEYHEESDDSEGLHDSMYDHIVDESDDDDDDMGTDMDIDGAPAPASDDILHESGGIPNPGDAAAANNTTADAPETHWGPDNTIYHGDGVPMPSRLLTDPVLRIPIRKGMTLAQMFFLVITWTVGETDSTEPCDPSNIAFPDNNSGRAAQSGDGEDMLKEWVKYTNMSMELHRQEYPDLWKRKPRGGAWMLGSKMCPCITLIELKAYLAILIIKGISKTPNMEAAWSLDENQRNAGMTKTMSLHRFKQINSFLAFIDPNDPRLKFTRGMAGYDPILRNRRFYDSLRESLMRMWRIGGIMTFDDVSGPRGGNGQPSVEWRGYGEMGCSTIKLCKELIAAGALRSGTLVIGDRLFTSIHLLRWLFAQSLYYIGTLKKNALHVPALFSKESLKRLGQRGEYVWRMSMDNVRAVFGKWMDAQWVLLATLGFPWTESSVKRRRTKHDNKQRKRSASTANPNSGEADGIDDDMRVALFMLLGEEAARRICLPFRHRTAKASAGAVELRKAHPRRTLTEKDTARECVNRVSIDMLRKLLRANCFNSTAIAWLHEVSAHNVKSVAEEFVRETYDVRCPLPVKIYNEFMVAVDKWNQEAHSTHSCPLKFRRLHKRIFLKLLESWIYAYVCLVMFVVVKMPELEYKLPRRPFNRWLRSNLADELAFEQRTIYATASKAGRRGKVRLSIQWMKPSSVLEHTPVTIKSMGTKLKRFENRAECVECRRLGKWSKSKTTRAICKKRLSVPKATHACVQCQPPCPLHLGKCFISHHMHVWGMKELAENEVGEDDPMDL
ncbi:hypothetical protein CYMTET_13233 [Cymbomonas tetramitiformis]|uniref:PiggyBac transposable element-derived protein domain-containing protein n=1 Tax=Cymbomonas tetramitiformis TaxID=36881 RepID=A0AAE0GIS9_9CHLO|nr:hypothetical protein CYMTET_13233 [Cymbomonas tetramitiformis]